MMDDPDHPPETTAIAVSSPRGAAIEDQLRESYGRAVYTHKTHEKCADILLRRSSYLKLAQLCLSALTTGTLIGALLDKDLAALTGAAVSTVLLGLTAYLKDYNLGEVAQKHKQAARDVWLIREQYLSLLTDIADNVLSADHVRKERDRLLAELHDVYSGAPSTNGAAYKAAQKALKEHGDMTFDEGELDALLPPQLKRGEDD